MNKGSRWIVLGALALAAAMLGGCATVQPWQRSRLANPCMMFDANAGQAAYDQHWLVAREGSAGGFGFQGGGCGCK
jgi:hypothetical protein